MSGSESEVTGRSSEIPDRLQGAINSARAASIGGLIFPYWALVGLVFTFVGARVEGSFDIDVAALWNLTLVNVLTSDTEISQDLGLLIASGLVVEFCLILFLLYRMRKGSFIGALLFLVLFVVETLTKLPEINALDDLETIAFTLMSLGFAGIIGVGIYSTSKFQRLSRKLCAGTQSGRD